MKRVAYMKSTTAAYAPSLSSFALLVGLMGVAGPALGQDQPKAGPPSATELFRDWKTLESWDETPRSYHTTKRDVFERGKVRRDVTLESVIRMKPGYRLESHSLKDEKTVFARSPGGMFAISRKKLDSPYALIGYTGESSTPAARDFERGATSIYCSYPLSAFDPRLTLHQVSQDPGFQISRILPQAGSLARVEFRWKADKELYTGYLIADTRRSSLVLECRYRTPDPSGGELVVDLRREAFASDPKKPVPECKSIETSRRFPDQTSQQTFTFSDYSYAPIPEEEFRLSFYGLPDPGRPAENRTPWYIWIAVVAGVCAALAFALSYLRKRRQARLASAIPGGTR